MCEIHTNRCPSCRVTWTQVLKLPLSCDDHDDVDPGTTGHSQRLSRPRIIKCPEWLCMYVGNERRPARRECRACREGREVRESRREFGEEADVGDGAPPSEARKEEEEEEEEGEGGRWAHSSRVTVTGDQEASSFQGTTTSTTGNGNGFSSSSPSCPDGGVSAWGQAAGV